MTIKTVKSDNTQSIEIEELDNHIVLTFNSDIDAFTVMQCRDMVSQNMSDIDNKIIIIDLTNVEFIDSHAVGLFVSILKRAHKAETRLIFIGVEGQPRSILKIVGFNDDIVCYAKDIQEALMLPVL